MAGDEMTYSDELRGAGLTAKERLGRIEELLGAIDQKLDAKANQVDLLALESRVREIEVRGSHQAADALLNVKDVQAQIRQLEENHSSLANKVTWAFGAVAALVVLGDLMLRFFVHA